MTGWEINPGKWEMTVSYPQGDVVAAIPPSTVDFERSVSLPITFAAHGYTNIELTLKQPGDPYWSRPDLGIDREDVKMTKGGMICYGPTAQKRAMRRRRW